MSHIDLDHLAESEIAQFYFPVEEENVIGFEIPVHDIVLVELFECLEELSEVDEGFWFGDEFLLLDEGLDGALIAVFVDEVEVVGRFEGLVEFDDVVILQRRQDIDLVDGELLEFGIGLKGGFGNDLNCKLDFALLMDGPVDLAIDPLTDGLLQEIIFHYLTHLKLMIRLIYDMVDVHVHNHA